MLDRFLVYQPSEWIERNWRQIVGLPLEEIWIQVSQGVRVFGWYVEAGPKQPVLLWCHGNAGNITHRVENLRDLYRQGLSVFLFDYRGYGKSRGSPSESGLYSDALAAYEFLTKERGVATDQVGHLWPVLGRRCRWRSGHATCRSRTDSGKCVPFHAIHG